jgi:hypothetical protein
MKRTLTTTLMLLLGSALYANAAVSIPSPQGVTIVAGTGANPTG